MWVVSVGTRYPTPILDNCVFLLPEIRFLSLSPFVFPPLPQNAPYNQKR